MSKVVYFIDDDLLNIKPFLSIPLSYSIKIWLRGLGSRIFLPLDKLKLVVATNYLMSKYAQFEPIKINPIEIKSRQTFIPNDSNPFKRRISDPHLYLCYHGTWSHKNDIKWLVPIIREVQNRCPNTIFEIIGGDRVGKLFKGIPRVEVLETMPWPQYLEHTSSVHQDIGLAPLMDTLFNRGRGPIKFFDYARTGAVGIYSKGPAFGDFVADGVDGFLLDNDPQLWAEKIVELVNNPKLRQSMADKAWGKVIDNSPASQSVQDYLNGFKT